MHGYYNFLLIAQLSWFLQEEALFCFHDCVSQQIFTAFCFRAGFCPQVHLFSFLARKNYWHCQNFPIPKFVPEGIVLEMLISLLFKEKLGSKTSNFCFSTIWKILRNIKWLAPVTKNNIVTEVDWSHVSCQSQTKIQSNPVLDLN